jgi:hypothetical protein
MSRGPGKTGGRGEGFESAVFSGPRRRDWRGRWLLFVSLLMLLGVVHRVARDVVYQRLLYGLAQTHFHVLASASVDRIRDVTLDANGHLTLHGAEVTTDHRGAHRTFFRAEEVRLVFDGTPLRDPLLRVMRIDLIRPEIFVRREWDGEWNLVWALVPSPRPAPELPSVGPAPEDPWRDYLRPDDSFPRNGLHIREGILRVVFAGRSGREVEWRATAVDADIVKVDGELRMNRLEGDFYGGRMKADAQLLRVSPLRIRQLKIDVKDADVSRMAEGAPFIPHPIRGRFNAVFALSVDLEKTGPRPITAGRCEIRDGDLWPLPAFSGIIHLLTLTAVEDKRIDSAVLEFTVEEDRFRVDQMHFLGYPVSIFGSGSASLTGDWIDISFLPRLGKEDWNSILPIIGAPLDLLSNIVKGIFVPITLKGSFSEPKFTVGAAVEPDAETRRRIEEKSRR